jgi:hypothetical protein
MNILILMFVNFDKQKNILHAFKMGADGIIMGEYTYNPMYPRTKIR